MTIKNCLNSCIIGAVSGFGSAIFGGVINKAQHDDLDIYQNITYGTSISVGYLFSSIILFYDACTDAGCLDCTGRGISRCHHAVSYFGLYTLSFIGGATAGVIVSNKFIADSVETENDTLPPTYPYY